LEIVQRLGTNVTVKFNTWLKSSLSVFLFFILWEIAPRAGWVKDTFVSPPSVVATAIWELLKTGEIFTHIGYSLERAFLGFLLATAIAIPLGFFLGGWFKTFQRIMTPLLRLLSELNPFSLFPVFMLLFGIDEFSKIVMIFWVCQWPILFNTITGVKNVDPLLIKAAKSMGADRKTLFFRVVLPAASPGIFTGLKMASGSAFFMLIAAEMIGASSGLGWLVWNAQINYQIPKLFAATVIISVLGLIITNLFTRVEKRIIIWK
jgi:NitT/TauT family transport system permease protein